MLYFQLGGKKLSFSREKALKLFNKSKHYILSGMMVTIFAQTDKVMLKLMINETVTGYYGAAVTCAGITGFVFSAVIDSFRPYIFEGRQVNENTFEHRLSVLYSIIIYLSLAQSVVFTILAKIIVFLLYGSAFLPSVGALRIVVWYTTFSYIGSARNIWILANNKQRYLWKINLMGALANVIINALLIPSIGIYGAAIASLVTQIFTNVIVGYIVKPIRQNNAIMVRGLNYKLFAEAVRKVINR